MGKSPGTKWWILFTYQEADSALTVLNLLHRKYSGEAFILISSWNSTLHPNRPVDVRFGGCEVSAWKICFFCPVNVRFPSCGFVFSVWWMFVFRPVDVHFQFGAFAFSVPWCASYVRWMREKPARKEQKGARVHL